MTDSGHSAPEFPSSSAPIPGSLADPGLPSRVRPCPGRRTGACLGLALLLFLVVPAGSLAQETLTPHRVARIQRVTDVALSPDGRHAAILRSVPRDPLKDENGPAWVEIHVVDTGNGASRPFVTGEITASELSWTPDGRCLAYLARRGEDETKSLYVIPADGGESRRLVSHGTDIVAYTFSPDGAEAAFLAKRPVPEATRQRRDQGFDQEIFEEDRPFVEVNVVSVDLFGMAESTTSPRTLTLEGSASLVAFSPVDQRLVVVTAPTPLVDDRYVARSVQVVDSRDGHLLASVGTEGKLGSVVWSPDGARLALIGSEDINDPREGRLLVAPANGGRAVDVVPGFQGHVTGIRWRDARTICFVAAEGLWTTVKAVGPDGGEPEVLVPAGGPIITSMDVDEGGISMAFVANAPEHPGELFLMGGDLEEPTRFTDSNPWLSEVRLAPQEAVTYRARDGLDLEGVLFRPLDETPGQRYPLILAVHGGPESHRSNGWLTSYSNPGQMAAAEGIAVFYPNYRGSTGRGVEFSKLGQGDPAGKEFDDVVDAIDHFVEAGLVDAERVGITGGSYGGYATAWGSTYYSDRFAAGVMFVGVSDNLSKFGTTDIPDEMFHVHQRKRVYDDWSFFLERSPIYHADKNQTPLLILHGKDDPRVHYSQSLELYRHVKKRGSAPTRLVLYAGEKHGNRKAAARLDYSLRMLRWMTHYLKGSAGDMPPYEIDYTPPGLRHANEEVPMGSP